MFCSQCGKEIPDNSNLCEHCGSPIIINVRKEGSVNNEGTISKSETHQSTGKRMLIVWSLILLVVGLFFFLFFFDKTESGKPTPSMQSVSPTPPAKIIVPKSEDEPLFPTPPVKTAVSKSTDATIIPKPTDETVAPTHPVQTHIPKSTDEAVIPKSTDEAVVPKSADESVIQKSTDETVAPTPPSSSSE